MRVAPLLESLPDHLPVVHGSGNAPWPTLLIVDSDPEMLRTLVFFFEKRGFHVAAAASCAEAKLLFARRTHWTMLISDYHLPDGTGWEFCCWVRDHPRAAPPFLLISASPNCAAFCPEAEFLAKPFSAEQLEARIRAMLPARAS
ncbi:MAG TPA: response regulator [Opitutaceae bacterium]|nr:response regulator [Opitutaceae bacterium]